MVHAAVVVATLMVVTGGASAWDEVELEIFDVVEEVNQNFYEFMGVSPDATSADIRRAYRQLSLVLHPDKSDADDAEVKFRWLVSVYEVLRDAERRKIYDRVLVEGLPDWRMPVFYYRRMRKMGLAEGLTYLFVIVTVCQYFVNWAAYAERRLDMRQLVSAQAKKMNRKTRKKGTAAGADAGVDVDEEESMIGPKPSIFDTLPFQSFRLLKYVIMAIPTLPSVVYATYIQLQEKKMEEKRLELEAVEEQKRKEREKQEKKEQRARRKNVERYRDRTGEVDDSRRNSDDDDEPPPDVDAFSQPANAFQIWTDQDLARLARLMKKYPAGTPERWERIADIMERLPWEVTKMVKKVKDLAYQVPISKSAQGVTGLEDKMVADECMEDRNDNAEYDSATDSSTSDQEETYGTYSVASKEDYAPVEVKVKKKTKGGKTDNVEDTSVVDQHAEQQGQQHWSQQEQKALEAALTQFPKGTLNRWDRIATKVPGRSKEECILRFKELAEIVRRKKEGDAS